MPTLSKPIAIRFDQDLVDLIEEVSAGQHMTKTDFIRAAVLEKLEDSYDLALAEQTFENWVAEGKPTYSHEELMKRYG